MLEPILTTSLCRRILTSWDSIIKYEEHERDDYPIILLEKRITKYDNTKTLCERNPTTFSLTRGLHFGALPTTHLYL